MQQHPAALRSAPAALPDAISPHALSAWPFGTLTPQQQLERQAMEAALAADALRGLPSCFGALA